MKIGLSLPQAGVNATRENVIKFAQAAEKENFDSLWVLERLLYPINPQTKYPGSADGIMPEELAKLTTIKITIRTIGLIGIILTILWLPLK